ncbi:hypothetical protein M2337_003114 [Sphingobium sp. B2D3A]|uniref:hypothetical protein n=1 Tax=unclassified Sphingobium TaxID=2611147 RepID=UPI002224158C|nr:MULTISPECIES: hypothetical protein [unclassified Sphingobium]MCW2338881.1 hypothetical protein [Sphingobium sp. B2D3A]MCW2385306.1 hypothetical protein [Sphingobium sp. B2D3D]
MTGETRAGLLEGWRAHLAEGRRRSLHTVRAYANWRRGVRGNEGITVIRPGFLRGAD